MEGYKITLHNPWYASWCSLLFYWNMQHELRSSIKQSFKMYSYGIFYYGMDIITCLKRRQAWRRRKLKHRTFSGPENRCSLYGVQGLHWSYVFVFWNDIHRILPRTHEIVMCHCHWLGLLYLFHIGSVAVMEKLNIEQERLMDLVQLKHHVEALWLLKHLTQWKAGTLDGDWWGSPSIQLSELCGKDLIQQQLSILDYRSFIWSTRFAPHDLFLKLKEFTSSEGN